MIKILFIKVNPIATSNLFLDDEENSIKNALNASENREHYDFQSIGAVTISELHAELENFKPNILHISGHGNNEGRLYFHDENNDKKEVSLKKFIEVVKNYQPNLKCVFLNACFSLMETEHLIIADQQAIIGMKKEIPNDTATIFSRSFYTSFFAGKSIHESFKSAIGVVGIDGFGDEHIPLILGKTNLKFSQTTTQDAEFKENQYTSIDDIINYKNLNMVRSSKKRHKRQYHFLIIAIAIIVLTLVGISLSQESIDTLTLLGLTPLATLKWIWDNLKGDEKILLMLDVLENDIIEFLERLKIPPPVTNTKEVIDGFNDKFLEIVGFK